MIFHVLVKRSLSVRLQFRSSSHLEMDGVKGLKCRICTVEYSAYFRFGDLNQVSTKATELLTKPFGFAWAAHLINAPHDRIESLLLGFE